MWRKAKTNLRKVSTTDNDVSGQTLLYVKGRNLYGLQYTNVHIPVIVY